jgi:hypothetical protein
MAQQKAPGTQGASPLPPPSPTDQGGNNIAAQTAYGPGGTLAPTNPNPQRGGTTIPQGQAGYTNPKTS